MSSLLKFAFICLRCHRVQRVARRIACGLFFARCGAPAGHVGRNNLHGRPDEEKRSATATEFYSAADGVSRIMESKYRFGRGHFVRRRAITTAIPLRLATTPHTTKGHGKSYHVILGQRRRDSHEWVGPRLTTESGRTIPSRLGGFRGSPRVDAPRL